MREIVLNRIVILNNFQMICVRHRCQIEHGKPWYFHGIFMVLLPWKACEKHSMESMLKYNGFPWFSMVSWVHGNHGFHDHVSIN